MLRRSEYIFEPLRVCARSEKVFSGSKWPSAELLAACTFLPAVPSSWDVVVPCLWFGGWSVGWWLVCWFVLVGCWLAGWFGGPLVGWLVGWFLRPLSRFMRDTCSPINFRFVYLSGGLNLARSGAPYIIGSAASIGGRLRIKF